MRIFYNHIFSLLLEEYRLPADFSFTIDIPPEVNIILEDTILLTDFGVTLLSMNKLYKATQEWENQSIIEDNENHFHVDWYIEPPDCKKSFMLGVKTTLLLANKFQKENINGIRCWYSFQTPELGKQMAIQNNIDDDEHFISDRISFYTHRVNEQIITEDELDSILSAILIIDV